MYTKFHGLYRKPFENTPDPHFLFPSKSHREVLASLRYGVYDAKGFILISGDVGTGKTTMINALLEHIDSSFITFNIHNPKWTFAEIITYIAKKLEIDLDGKNPFELIDDLQATLEDLDYHEKRVVLIIDEAHLLPASTLEDIRLLSNIEKQDRKLIQIILVGQNEIYQTLEKDSLRTLKQRIVINRRLKSLAKNEIDVYIKYRLRIAGRQSALFSDRAVALIRHRSQGVPRIINHICDNAMLIGYAKGIAKIGPAVIKEVIADMDAGMKKNRFAFFSYVDLIKWAGAFILVLILSALIARHFFADQNYYQDVEAEQSGISGDRAKEPAHREASRYTNPVKEIAIQNSSTQGVAEASEVHATVEGQPVPMTGEAQQVENIASLAQDVSNQPGRQPLEVSHSSAPLNASTPRESISYSQSVNGSNGIGSLVPDDADAPEVHGTSESQPARMTAEVRPTKSIARLSEEKLFQSGPQELETPALDKPLEDPLSNSGKNPKQNSSTDEYPKLIVVQPNDNLTKIAEDAYGLANSTIVDFIQRVNPHIKDINRIFVGQKIYLPQLKRDDLIFKSKNGYYHIHYASFYTSKDAMRCLDELGEKIKNIFLIHTYQQKTEVYRVYYGWFKNSHDAHKKLNALELKYLNF